MGFAAVLDGVNIVSVWGRWGARGLNGNDFLWSTWVIALP